MYHFIETGQLQRDLSAESPRLRVALPANLEPFKPLIQERLTAFPALSSLRLLAECRAAGYAGFRSMPKVARMPGRMSPETSAQTQVVRQWRAGL